MLIDALHLFRTGGSPQDVHRAPPGAISFVQLCDAVAQVPDTPETLLLEARSGRLAPGCGMLPLNELLAELDDKAVLSLEVPTNGDLSAEKHAENIFKATQKMMAAIKAPVCL